MRRHPRMLLGALVALGVVATGVAVPMPRATADHQGFVHAVWSSGRGSILDGANQPLFLRGVQMECWLLGGGSCWGGGPTAETETYQNLAKLVGQSDLEHFRTDLYNTYVADPDVGRVAHLGFNTVRVAINHAALDSGSQAGWAALDNLLAAAERDGVYVILDLHAAPSPQSTAANADAGGNRPTLWQKNGKKWATVTLWRRIAERYRDRRVIAGYDLLNEPDTGGNSKQLVSLIEEITAAIRDVDTNHMLIVQGDGSGANPRVFKHAVDDNEVYAFHTYTNNGLQTDGQINYMRAVSREQHVPIINGEFGQNSVNWVRDARTRFEDPRSEVNGWIYWSWKGPGWDFANGSGQLVEQWQPTPAWQRTIAWASNAPVPMNESGTWPRPSGDEARVGMSQFLQIVQLANTREPLPLLVALGLNP